MIEIFHEIYLCIETSFSPLMIYLWLMMLLELRSADASRQSFYDKIYDKMYNQDLLHDETFMIDPLIH